MRTRLLPLLLTATLALALASSSSAQTLASATISTAGADCATATNCADFDVSGVPSFALHIEVAASGTYNFEASVDATSLTSGTWFAVTDDVGGTSTLTADGAKSFTNPGWRRFRIRASAISGAGTVVAFRGVASAQSAASAVTPGTAAGNLGKAEDAAHASGDTGIATWGVADATNATQRAAAGDYTQVTTDEFGTLLGRSDHPNRIRCTVTVSTATTLTAVGGSCAAPGAGLSIYVTDILFASNAQAIAADAFPTLKYGTGGTCGTGTTVFWGAFMTAATQATTVQSLQTPIKIPANNELCWINSTAGSKFIVITGFIAP